MASQSSIPGSPWHEGERMIQAKYGMDEKMAQIGARVVRDYMPDQHRDFYNQLPFMILGTVDQDGMPWASLLEGPPGFVCSPDPKSLQLYAQLHPEDPGSANLKLLDAVGLLGIELHTRRRNRVNGYISDRDAQSLYFAVEQSFGNCPQYIQTRHFHFAHAAGQGPNHPSEHLDELDEAARAQIAKADTFFVASYVEKSQTGRGRAVDVSHRGGKRGFVKAEGNQLTIPDFSGNYFFNTLGNLQLNPRAGLIFVDFENGDLLQLSGHTELVFEGSELESFEGAERLWRLKVTKLVRRRAATALRWRFDQFSPHSLRTGSWA